MLKHCVYITTLIIFAICFLPHFSIAEMSVLKDAELEASAADIGILVPKTLNIRMTAYAKNKEGNLIPSGKIHLKIHVLSTKTPEMVQQEKSMAEFIAYNKGIVNSSSMGIIAEKKELYKHLYPDITGDTTIKLIPGTGQLYENYNNYYTPNTDVNRSFQLLDDQTTTTRIVSENTSISITTQDSNTVFDFSR